MQLIKGTVRAASIGLWLFFVLAFSIKWEMEQAVEDQ